MIWEVGHWANQSLLDGIATITLLWEPVLEAHEATQTKLSSIWEKKTITKAIAELGSDNPRAPSRQYTEQRDLQLKPFCLWAEASLDIWCTLAMNPSVLATTLSATGNKGK